MRPVTYRDLRFEMLVALAALLVGGLWQRHVAPAGAPCWLALSALGVLYLLAYTLRHLGENRPASDTPLYPTFGAANGLTLLRGLAVALLLGFFCPRTAQGWVPGALYTFVALSDWWDGFLARRTRRASLLGQRLDLMVDGLGVLVASALAVVLGRLPWWYLSVGLARYAFLLWEAGLRALGRSPQPLPPEPQRRANAGLMMGFLAVALWPVFPPQALTLVGVWFFIPFAAGFLRDALWVIHPRSTSAPHEKPLLGAAYALVRLLSAAGLGALLWSHPLSGWLRWSGSLLVGLLALGVLPRLAALGGLLTFGAAWAAGLPLSPITALLSAGLTAIAFYGGGAACLWAPDERFFLTRAGVQPPVKG
ncbi:MAG TPA: CDP-alcohol phosphatidyltransferase family protein [Anaerolineaceae bacterium]|nr:CDP-alcohol phosphatidyltransferase family protein [Anaerolineaceae bacterium]